MLILTFAVPALVWLLVLLHVSLGWRGRMHAELDHFAGKMGNKIMPASSTSIELHGPAELPGKVQAGLPSKPQAQQAAGDDRPADAVEKALDKVNNVARNSALASSDDASGKAVAVLMASKDAAAKIAGRLFKKKKTVQPDKPPKPPSRLSIFLAKLRDSPWTKLGMFARSEALTLWSQWNILANPGPTYPLTITVPICIAVLIAVQAIVSPLFHILEWEQPMAVLQGALAVGYFVIAVPGLQSLFFEDPPPGELPEFKAVTGQEVLNQCIAATLPVLSFALVLHGVWGSAIKAAAERELIAAGADKAALEAGSKKAKPTAFRAAQLTYLVISWGVGVLALAALFGWNCGQVLTTCCPTPATHTHALTPALMSAIDSYMPWCSISSARAPIPAAMSPNCPSCVASTWPRSTPTCHSSPCRSMRRPPATGHTAPSATGPSATAAS